MLADGETFYVGIFCAIIAFYLAVVAACVTFSAWLFQYNLNCLFGCDVPWYYDLAGAFVFNGVNIPVALICVIAQACGVETPFFTCVC